MHLQDIPPAVVPKLAKILQFRPLEDARKQIPTQIRSLPSRYRPGRLEKILLPPSEHLCRLHKGLDPEVVHVLLHRLQHEVGPRLNNPTSKCELLSPDQRKRLVRLRSLHALWLSPKEYEVTFLASLQDTKWKPQECEACIISRISGDMETLLDLRWTIRSRATSRHVAKHGNPRLQVWVEEWIALLAEHTSKHTGEIVDLDSVYLKNEAEAVLLKRARAKIHDVRINKLKIKKVGDLAQVAHSAGTGSTGDVSPVDGPDDDDDDDDSDALDAYLNTKGHSPYSYAVRKSTQESLYSVDTMGNGNNARTAAPSSGLDKVKEEQQEYVPPRQEWRAAAQPSRIYFTPMWESKDGGGSRTSWETERFDMQTVHVQPGKASRRNPADTYLNLVDDFPTESSASIKAPSGSSVVDGTRRHDETGAVKPSTDMSTNVPGKHRDEIDRQSRKVGKGNSTAAVFVVDNASQSSWGGLYESQVRLRTDLDWFYGQSQRI